MVAFIDHHRDTYGVEPICAVLPIAPSTYFLRQAQQQDPEKRSARARGDDDLRAAIRRVWDEHDQAYGPRKVWKQLHRDGKRVARCTVERLMREMALRGVSRGRAWVITTRAEDRADRPADLVDRQFHATRPNQLWVADFTYVATWRGFVYVAFVIDVFARRIVGWRVSASLATGFVLDALEGEDLAAFERHLADGCRDCERSILESREAVHSLARLLPPASPPPDLKRRILGQLGPIPGPPKRHRPLLDLRAWARIAVAASLFLFASLTALFAWDDWSVRRERDNLASEIATVRANWL